MSTWVMMDVYNRYYGPGDERNGTVAELVNMARVVRVRPFDAVAELVFDGGDGNDTLPVAHTVAEVKEVLEELKGR